MSDIENPEILEVVPGFSHDQLEGWIPQLATDDEIRGALEKAFDYRGDVTITLKNGTQVEGYIFDRQNGATLADSRVRVFPKNYDSKLSIPYSEIQARRELAPRNGGSGEPGDKNRHVEQARERHQAADMIGMLVRDQDGVQLFSVFIDKSQPG
jgi:hypothetical protein